VPGREERIRVAEMENFEQALRGAREDLWWRKFIETVKERRMAFIDSLVAGDMDQRSEDRTRGQISELNFIIGLDLYAENKNGRTESDNGTA